MKVLENDFSDKDVVLIHDKIIIDGCQDFTITQDELSLHNLEIPPYLWYRVVEEYTGVSTEEEIMLHVKSQSAYVRSVIAIHGGDVHRDILVTDPSVVVRAEVAKWGNDSHRDVLIKDDSPTVRRVVAMYGNYRHVEKLSSDSEMVVKAVALVRFENWSN